MALPISLLPRLPHYRCHKVVQAARIVSVTSGDDGSKRLELQLRDSDAQTYTAFFVADELEGRPDPEKDGFLLLYADNYVSFSPAKSFLEGYTLAEV
jgi:hypothetical protein